jgi:hypothetical protein
VVEALVADGWKLSDRDWGRMTVLSLMDPNEWIVQIAEDGAVRLSGFTPRYTSTYAAPSVSDDEVVRIIAAVCAPDLFGGAA